jgi:hypothetical protein
MKLTKEEIQVARAAGGTYGWVRLEAHRITATNGWLLVIRDLEHPAEGGDEEFQTCFVLAELLLRHVKKPADLLWTPGWVEFTQPDGAIIKLPMMDINTPGVDMVMEKVYSPEPTTEVHINVKLAALLAKALPDIDVFSLNLNGLGSPMRHTTEFERLNRKIHVEVAAMQVRPRGRYTR